MEIMADLKKVPSDLPLSESTVSSLARKFSPINTHQNVHQEELWIGSLHGKQVPMDGRTIMGGGVELPTSDGKKGVFFDETPEERALNRWREGRFKEFEHELAERWRSAIREVDLQGFASVFRKSFPKGQAFRSLDELAQAVFLACEGRGAQYRLLTTLLDDLVVDSKLRQEVITRWKSMNRPRIRQFAPYAIYCHAVNLFFYVGLGQGLIGTRATNRIDLQYLYYLPFCKVFTSGDKFHRQIAPLFLQKNQIFLDSSKLKADLGKVADLWDNADDETKKKGTMRFVRYPPMDLDLATARIWDLFVPEWRKQAMEPEVERTPNQDAATMKRLQPMIDAIERYKANNPDPQD